MPDRTVGTVLLLSLGAALLWCTFHGLLNPPGLIRADSRKDIPGNSDLQHCDSHYDPYKPDSDIFDLTYLQIEPNPLILGHNVTISATGFFSSEVSKTPNATVYVFAEMNHGSLAVWGEAPFCNVTHVWQRYDGDITGEKCPPIEGHAKIGTRFEVDEGFVAGIWNIAISVENGTSLPGKKPARLFCVEGKLGARRWRTHMMWRLLEAVLPKSLLRAHAEDL